MWIEGDRLHLIDSALEQGRRHDIDRLLADILTPGAGEKGIQTACPSCRRDLIRNTLPAAGLYVSACPGGHGAWMADDVAETLRGFVDEHATLAARKRHQLRVLNRLLVVLAILAPVSILLTYPERVIVSVVGAVDSIHDHRVSETSWPSRGWIYKTSIPTKGSVIDAHEELQFFHGLLSALDDGITNRLNIDGVMKTRRSPAQYRALYTIYRDKQLDVLDRLRRLDVPDRVKPIHVRLIRATEQQIDFYGAFVDAKLRDPSVDLGRMLGEPALKTVNAELRTAWSDIKRLYPNLDEETARAIESHLCGFDVI